jgi:hypothetical protein
MKSVNILLASLMLMFGMVSIGHAASTIQTEDSFAVYQTDSGETDAEKKKKAEGEEEEPDC